MTDGYADQGDATEECGLLVVDSAGAHPNELLFQFEQIVKPQALKKRCEVIAFTNSKSTNPEQDSTDYIDEAIDLYLKELRHNTNPRPIRNNIDLCNRIIERLSVLLPVLERMFSDTSTSFPSDLRARL